MLNKPISGTKILLDCSYSPGFSTGSDGRVNGVTSEGETVKCGAVIGDPSYFPEKVKKIGDIVRCICILNHPIPNTSNSESVQIILPQAQLKRRGGVFQFPFFLTFIDLF